MLASAEAAHSILLRSAGSTRLDKPPRHATKVRPWVQPATFEKGPRAFSAQTFGTHSRTPVGTQTVVGPYQQLVTRPTSHTERRKALFRSDFKRTRCFPDAHV